MEQQDYILFAIGCTGGGVLIKYSGPDLTEHQQQCATEMMLEGTGDSEVMDAMEFDTEFPTEAGIYEWYGRFCVITSTDWESGIVDDWHLSGTGCFKKLAMPATV